MWWFFVGKRTNCQKSAKFVAVKIHYVIQENTKED